MSAASRQGRRWRRFCPSWRPAAASRFRSVATWPQFCRALPMSPSIALRTLPPRRGLPGSSSTPLFVRRKQLSTSCRLRWCPATHTCSSFTPLLHHQIRSWNRWFPLTLTIEDCGDLPPTLAALLWEDFSRQDYEVALKRVLDSIFEADLRPPLGKPPAYVRAEVFPMEGLAPNDRLILEALCRNTIATGFALIDDIAPVVEALKKQGISEQQIVETQDLLEELGYVKLRRTAGPAHPYCQTVTQLGFEKFANARISGFQNLIDTVRQRVLVQGDQLENAELAKALGQPLRIVSHVLEVMEDRGWITLTREIGGGYESLRVDLVSPSLKHR